MPALKHRSFRGEKSDKKKFFNFDREPKKSIISKDEMIARKAKQERDKNKGAGSNIQTKGKTKPKSSSPGSSKAGMSGKKSTTSTAKAGSNIKKSGGKNFNVGVSKGGVSFGEAFRHFKNKGVKEFTWNGKRYTTKSK